MARVWFWKSISRPLIQPRWGKTNFTKFLPREGRLVNPFPLFNEKRRCSSEHLQEILFSAHCTLLPKAFREKHNKKPGCKRCRGGPEEAEGNGEPTLCFAEENEGGERDKVTIYKKKQSEKRAVHANGKSWHENKKG